jgi:nitrite reductase/ring-hydroxylating ferredoxin subunit
MKQEQWHRRCQWIHHEFSTGILFLLMLSTSAWILSGPSSCQTCRTHISHPSTILRLPRTRVAANRNQGEGDQGDAKNDYGFFSRLTSNKKKEPEETKEESLGFLRSLSKKLESARESREAKNRAEKEAELAAILERESRISGMVSFPNFNTSGFATAFRNVSGSFSLVKDSVLSIRSDKTPLTVEEKRLADLRARTENEKVRRLAALQLADQRAVERRKKLEQAERELKKAKKKGEGNDSSSNDQPEPRSNPLSVAQKYVSGFFESPTGKEEWLVVAPKTRIAPGQMVPVTAAGLDLLLVASKDGSALYCTANSCPHLGTPLEVGMLERRPIEPSAKTANKNNSTRDEEMPILQETDIANLLTQDGCEDCIVCPLHKTAFALASGEVRGEWCPYPPVIGKVMGVIKSKSSLPTFDVRTRGKNIEVRINSPLEIPEEENR